MVLSRLSLSSVVLRLSSVLESFCSCCAGFCAKKKKPKRKLHLVRINTSCLSQLLEHLSISKLGYQGTFSSLCLLCKLHALNQWASSANGWWGELFSSWGRQERVKDCSAKLKRAPLNLIRCSHIPLLLSLVQKWRLFLGGLACPQIPRGILTV